jgi:hypothetical protein
MTKQAQRGGGGGERGWGWGGGGERTTQAQEGGRRERHLCVVQVVLVVLGLPHDVSQLPARVPNVGAVGQNHTCQHHTVLEVTVKVHQASGRGARQGRHRVVVEPGNNKFNHHQ